MRVSLVIVVDAASNRRMISDSSMAWLYGRLRRYEEALVDYRSGDDGSDPHAGNIARMCLALGRLMKWTRCHVSKNQAPFSREQHCLDIEFTDELSEMFEPCGTFWWLRCAWTLGDGGVGLRVTATKCDQHCAATIQRFLKFQKRYGWTLKRSPVVVRIIHRSLAMADILGLPYYRTPTGSAGFIVQNGWTS